VIKHHITWAIKRSYTAVPQTATTLGERFEGNGDKQPQSGVVEESRVPEVFLLQRLHGNWRWAFWAPLLQSSVGRNLKPCIRMSMFIKHFMLARLCIFRPSCILSMLFIWRGAAAVSWTWSVYDSVKSMCIIFIALLGEWAKLRKATICGVMPVRPSVCMEQLGFR